MIMILIIILQKVAIAMYCNLRPPDVTPVVLGFKYTRPMHQLRILALRVHNLAYPGYACGR